MAKARPRASRRAAPARHLARSSLAAARVRRQSAAASRTIGRPAAMRTDLLARLAATRGFIAKIWYLAKPYWFTEDVAELRAFGTTVRVPERWIARGLLAIIIAANVAVVYASKLLNEWNARFFNALQAKDEPAFWGELRYFVVLVFILIVILVYRLWLRQMLSIRWRRWLTDVYTRDWLRDRVYYRMELSGRGTDNPEQRIEQDINIFTTQTLTITLGLLSEIMTLVTFTVVLWNLSGNFTVPIFGGVQIPGYMLWVALVYAVIGSYLTYRIGRPLVQVNFDLERYNADFRYKMTRIRENAESVALYGGEPDEGRRLQGAFGRIYDTWWAYMTYNKRLTWLTVFYGQVASIFPIVVAAPRYFAGEVQLGALTQTAGAFGQVQGSLSWFVESFASLADWKATTDRLTTFADAMAAARRAQVEDHGFDVTPGTASDLAVEDARIALPQGRVLLDDVDLSIGRGEHVVIQGPSGSGKTTLFRVLAGLWPFGRGRVRLPAGARVLFLPQRPYLPIGTLKETMTYPDRPEGHDDAACTEALTACRLDHLAGRLGETENWSLALSPGEQQRLGFARALLYRPDWLFLDEATSALDEPTEAHLYGLLQERLPQATLVSIAHKPTVLRFHERRLVIDPQRQAVTSEPLPAPAE
jgi:putative ATP-binding cassette transporter